MGKAGNFIRIVALAVPWLCAVAFPIVKIDCFFESVWRILFFDLIMVPFGNIALLGMAASDGGWSFMSIATLVFAGIVAPIVIALLFVRYWRRWQFVLVWLGYLALVAWDTIIATCLAVVIVRGGALR